MKATLNLQKIAGFRGVKQVEFEKGVVNEVIAGNAGGKTSISRALGTVLSGLLTHDEIIGDAKKQGISRESLQNIYEKDAVVSLSYDGQEQKWYMKSDGSFGGTKGDQRFVEAGMLTQEARSIRQLIEGNSDFSWVTRLLSYAQWYAIAKAFVDSKITSIEQEIERIAKRQETLVEEDRKLKTKKEGKLKLDQERDQLAQKLDVQKRQHVEKIKSMEYQIDLRRQRIAQYEAGISESKQRIKYFNGRLDSGEKNLQEIRQRVDGIDLDAIRKEVRQNVPEIDGKIASLRSEVDALSGKRSTLTDAKNVLAQRGETEGSCPVCEVSTVTSTFLDEKISELNRIIRSKDSEIQELASQRTRELQKEATAVRQIDDLNKMINDIQKEKRELELRKSTEEKMLDESKRGLAKVEQEQVDLNTEKAKLEEETEQWEAEVHDTLQRIERSIEVVAKEIADQIKKIRESSLVDVREMRMSFDEAQNVWLKAQDKLQEWREYFDQRQHDHEMRAIADFNNTVKRVMADLGFSEFDQIAIDKDDKQLKIFRPGFVRQPVESLSTSEKYSIAIVLQIALKETYVPEIPFFIVDEVMVSYDGTKTEKILDYLSEMAREKGIYTIVTRLTEKGEEEITVKVR